MDAATFLTVSIILNLVFIFAWAMDRYRTRHERKIKLSHIDLTKVNWWQRDYCALQIYWLGHQQALETMNERNAPFLAAMRLSFGGATPAFRQGWEAFVRFLRPLAECETSDDKNKWLAYVRQELGIPETLICEQSVLLILRERDDERMIFYESIKDNLGRFLRLAQGDYTALSMDLEEFVAYLRYCGITEAKVADEVKKYLEQRGKPGLVDAIIEAHRTNAQPSDGFVERGRKVIEKARAGLSTLSDKERAAAELRINTIEQRLTASDRVRVAANLDALEDIDTELEIQRLTPTSDEADKGRIG